ncbi:MAG: DNA mismatch repair endonuclease MutL [Lachnospiraceae bacterium]|nr:DNA mismatch repair endonuclease MutL [Lachnospiraceae bacterium]
MSKINVLDKSTIDKIAAGEVVDRPSSIVKELMENAIDAKASAVTVEIKEGGISYIRITDNGEGIRKSDIKTAFLRHATSKIKTSADLLSIHSLGFRGEALSSIAAVSQVECISKTPDDLTGLRYSIEGGEEKGIEEVGAPFGTTFIIRNLFYNTPARRKFLKSKTTEASYIAAIVEKIALSNPGISIRFIVNSNSKLHTSGNGRLKDIIYTIFGKDVASNIIETDSQFENMKIKGYIGKPVVTRGNRNNMVYFINGRYIKSKIINSAIEDAYKPYIMQHNYPFCVLDFLIDPELIDVNVHPSKMEIRFENQNDVYNFFYNTVSDLLKTKEFINEVKYDEDEKKDEKIVSEPSLYDNQVIKPALNVRKTEKPPEPFETRRIEKIKEELSDKSLNILNDESNLNSLPDLDVVKKIETGSQQELFDGRFLSKKEKMKHKMIGQLFDTYWLIEYNTSLYIVDQHAAHEKVLYERTMTKLKNKEFTSQQLNPPIILTLSMEEEMLIKKFEANFKELGFEIEHFGGKEYAVYAVPDNMYSIGSEELLRDIIDNLDENSTSLKSELITEKIASMSCKAAVKGNNKLSFREADELISELLTLDNPYNCPHGRPTIISMSRYELEKKFKRII